MFCQDFLPEVDDINFVVLLGGTIVQVGLVGRIFYSVALTAGETCSDKDTWKPHEMSDGDL